MKKTALLFIPLMALLSCKKNHDSTPVVETSVKVDMANPLKDIVFANYEQTIDHKMNDLTDINYLGYVTDQANINNNTISTHLLPSIDIQARQLQIVLCQNICLSQWLLSF